MITSDMQLKLIEKLIFASDKQIKYVYEYFLQFENKKPEINIEKSNNQSKNFFSGKNLADSEYVGLWQNKDISDSLEFAEMLRNKSQNRNL